MPSKPASNVKDACARRARYVTHYVRRMSAKCNAESDKNQVFAGAYIAYVAFFESQLEDLFIGLMTGRYSHPRSAVGPVVVMPNRDVAKSIVTAGRPYVDWLPFDQNLKKRAPSFLIDGEPFNSLSPPRKQALKKASTIRNALAHASDHSKEQFHRTFIQSATVPLGQRSPAPYLRGAHSLNMSRFEVLVTELVQVMDELTS